MVRVCVCVWKRPHIPINDEPTDVMCVSLTCAGIGRAGAADHCSSWAGAREKEALEERKKTIKIPNVEALFVGRTVYKRYGIYILSRSLSFPRTKTMPS